MIAPRVKAYLYTWGPPRYTAEGDRIPAKIENLDIGYIDGMLLLPLVEEHNIDERSPLCGHTHETLMSVSFATALAYCIYSFSHSLIHSHTHSLARSLTHARTHALTHSLVCSPQSYCLPSMACVGPPEAVQLLLTPIGHFVLSAQQQKPICPSFLFIVGVLCKSI